MTIERLRDAGFVVSYVDPFSNGDWRGTAYAHNPTTEAPLLLTSVLGGDYFSGGPIAVYSGRPTMTVVDEQIKMIAMFENLEVLRLDATGSQQAANRLTENGMVCIGRLKELRYLDISGAPISRNVLKSWGEFSQLETLRLTKTALTDKDVETLPDLPTLRTLSLYGTQVTDVGLMNLPYFPNLRSANLSQTAVTKVGADLFRSRYPGTQIVYDE